MLGKWAWRIRTGGLFLTGLVAVTLVGIWTDRIQMDGGTATIINTLVVSLSIGLFLKTDKSYADYARRHGGASVNGDVLHREPKKDRR